MSVWTHIPVLAGTHVTLRPLRRDDGPALIAAASAGGLWDMFFAGVAQLKDIERWLDKVMAEQDYGRAQVFTVLNAAGAVIGTTRFMRMAPTDRRLEIGGTFYALSAQRTGVNTEAKLLLLTHAFQVMGCQCVQIRTDWLNQRSRTSIERLGAHCDGVLRGHAVTAGGRIRDTVVYSILDREWPGVRDKLVYLLARHEREVDGAHYRHEGDSG